MNKIKFESKKDIIEYIMFGVNIALFVFFTIALIGFIAILVVSLIYNLTDFIKWCIINSGMCVFFLFTLYKSDRLKEIRSRYFKLLFTKK